MEDLIEEIVGDIRDEQEKELREIDEIAANRYIVDGRTDIGKVNERLGVKLPEDEFETVGGFVLGLFGRLPAEGDQIRYNNLHVYRASAAEKPDRPHPGAEICRRKQQEKEEKMKTPLVLETNLAGLKPPKRGKVRDIYDLGDTLLIVATDRISAFDVVLPNAVPEKGRVLTQISKFWFSQTETIVKNHLISTDVKDFPAACRPHAALLEGRSMLVKKSQPLPVECIVRGYLTGSGLKEYKINRLGERHQASARADRGLPSA